MKQRSGAAIAAMIRKAAAVEMARQIGEAGFQGRALSAYIILSPFRLTCPCLPMIKWS
jgi:hypothetical protein